MSRHFTSCPRHVTSCHVVSRYVTSCHVMYLMPRHGTSCNVMSYHVMSRHMSRHVTSCHILPRHVTSCHIMLRHITSKVAGRSRDQTLHCQLTSSTRNQFKLSMTVFVGCPEGLPIQYRISGIWSSLNLNFCYYRYNIGWTTYNT